MWVGARRLKVKDPLVLENTLLFARRFDIISYSSGASDPRDLKDFLKTCKKLNIEKTWIEIGPGKEMTAKEFVQDSARRASVLRRFEKLAAIYKNYYPDFARITIFDEAPLGAFGKSPKAKDNYLHHLSQFKEYGPEAFSYLYQAIKKEMPSAETGLFMHHPHNASSGMAGKYSVIEQFMKDCQEYESVPDFIFSDVYRGYLNRGNGVQVTDNYITDVVSHTAKLADQYGIKAYQLGQMHTMKLGYTPSRYQIDRNVRAMLKGNPDGIGWYWPNYASTNYKRGQGDGIGSYTGFDVSFRPFVPNAWGDIAPAGSVYATAKDRFVYSYLRMLEEKNKVDADTHFDLWLYGYDFDHTEHTVFLKTNNKDNPWVKIGHFNPQQDKDGYEKGAREKYMYSFDEKWHAIAFHGLLREKFLNPPANGRHLEIKIETSGKSDSSGFSAAYALPYRKTRNYLTESQITHMIEKHPRWVEINSLFTHVRPEPLELNKNKSVKINLK